MSFPPRFSAKLATVIGWIAVAASSAFGSDCAFVSEWSAFNARMTKLRSGTPAHSGRERGKLFAEEEVLRETTSRAAIRQLLADERTYGDIVTCVEATASSRAQNLLARVQSDLLTESTRVISGIRSPSAEALSQRLEASTRSGHLPLFRILSPRDAPPTDKKAGYSSISSDLFHQPSARPRF